MDLHLVYRETRRRLIALAPSLDDTQLTTMTLACPAWSVRDIYAHLCGLATDLADGVERAGHPDQTARQVAERADWAIHEVCDEWSSSGPALEERIAAEAPNLRAPVIDVWTHEQDLTNAIGLEQGRDGAGLQVAYNVAWRMKRLLHDAGIAPMRVVTGDIDWMIGDGEPGATVRLSSYELARAVLGRRSFDQIRAYDWDGDAERYIEFFPVFTPPAGPIVE